MVSVDKKKRLLAVVPAATMDGQFFLEDAADATLANREAAREDDASNVITIDVDIIVYFYCVGVFSSSLSVLQIYARSDDCIPDPVHFNFGIIIDTFGCGFCDVDEKHSFEILLGVGG